jgi:hypothetical protein
MSKNNDGFSVSLGLFDYINPILYTITSFTIIKNMKGIIESPYYNFLIIGAVLSLIFGFIIPTGKFIVGLGIIKFRMPVSLVFLVNSGILIFGMVLFKNIFNIKLWLFLLLILVAFILLLIIYMKKKKFNTVAVLTGAIGYLLIYASLIKQSINNNLILPIVLYVIAICLFVMLCGIGIKANLKDSKVHWIIEISNVLCQLSVAIGTIILFR